MYFAFILLFILDPFARVWFTIYFTTLRGFSYTGIAHRGMFSVPKFLREAVEAETRVITREAPLFVV